jgi:trk system potassium uptake protein TrkH
MNYKKLGGILGKIMILEGLLMLLPLTVALIYQESMTNIFSYVIPIAALAIIGMLLQIPKPKREELYQKEAFALVAAVWIVMAAFGALPFVINRDIPNYVDAFFEIVSGFTTTGASILPDVTTLSHSSLFWRSFSHWIGGMGILVFILIFIPEGKDGSSMHLLRAESPGPQVGKITSKMKVTARILYLIYLGLTVLEVIVLMFDQPIAGYENEKFFFSLLTAFGSAGTGGFGFLAGSMEMMNPFSQYVIAIFLLLFGVNFALYYLLLIGKIKQVFKSSELKLYIALVVGAATVIFVSLVTRFQAFPQIYTTEEAFRHSLFQVASIITTTGFSTTDFALWPMAAIAVLVVLMIVGAMAGSTAGGMKVSRLAIASKGIYINLRKLINPRYVPKTKLEDKPLEEKTINNVFSFITLYFFILFGVVFLLSFDPINGSTLTVVSDAYREGYEVTHGFFSNFSASLACISNIGPGLEAVGPYSSYAEYSVLSKILLSFLMLIGRLEILPVFVLFNPRTWKRS